jgi:hypothetical protein
MVSTLVFSLVGVTVILALEGVGPFKSEHSSHHAIEGLICIILASIQPLMAALRPPPDAKYLPKN